MIQINRENVLLRVKLCFIAINLQANVSASKCICIFFLCSLTVRWEQVLLALQYFCTDNICDFDVHDVIF